MDAYDVVMCGKIEGDKDFVEKFAKAYAQIRQSVLKRTGRLPKVWNPALLSLECPDREYAWYLQKCYDAIFASPKATVVLLADWAESKGARAEHATAMALRMDVAGVEEIVGSGEKF